MSTSGDRKWGTYQLVYFGEGLDQLILSKEAYQSLGIIKEDFPAIGSFGNADINCIFYSGGVEGAFAYNCTASQLPLRRSWRT